jgi:hypothetical protein
MRFKINNATAVYAIMLAVYAAGMWAILAVGSTLRPQPDLAGEWEFVREDASGQADAAKVERVTVEQSGRFVRLRFRAPDANPTINLKIKDWREHLGNPMDHPPIVMDDPAGKEAVFGELSTPDTYRVDLPNGDRYSARFVTRFHPRPTAAVKSPTTVPAATQHAP